MFLFFGDVCTVCFSTPLEVLAGWFSWSPLEVGTRYLYGASCICMRGALVVLFWMGSIFPFVNISLTSSMAANCELQMLAGTSLNAAAKNCIAPSRPDLCVVMEREGAKYVCFDIEKNYLSAPLGRPE